MVLIIHLVGTQWSFQILDLMCFRISDSSSRHGNLLHIILQFFAYCLLSSATTNYLCLIHLLSTLLFIWEWLLAKLVCYHAIFFSSLFLCILKHNKILKHLKQQNAVTYFLWSRKYQNRFLIWPSIFYGAVLIFPDLWSIHREGYCGIRDRQTLIIWSRWFRKKVFRIWVDKLHIKIPGLDIIWQFLGHLEENPQCLHIFR